MTKRKISKKRKKLRFEDIPITRLKKGIKTVKVSATKRMQNTSYIYKALVNCIVDGDEQSFKEIIRSYYEAINTVEALKEIGLSRRTFYSSTSDTGNPSLKTIVKMMQGLKKAS